MSHRKKESQQYGVAYYDTQTFPAFVKKKQKLRKGLLKNPAYGRQSISRTMRIVAPMP